MNHPKMEFHVIAYLEMLGIPYTGSSPVTIAQTFDKQAILAILRDMGVPTPRSHFATNEAELLAQPLPFPVLVKPNSTDGSFGITARNVARSREDLLEAYRIIREEFGVSGPVLVQEYLPGPDVNVGILGNGLDEPTVLPVTEEDYSALPSDRPKICGFENKVRWVLPLFPSLMKCLVGRVLAVLADPNQADREPDTGEL